MPTEESRCEERPMPQTMGGIGSKTGDVITEKLRAGAIDSINAYLIRCLEMKDFCQANRVGEALRKLV